MADSLVISGGIELLGGGVTSQNPACAGAQFRLQQGFDLSAPQPTTDFVASLILDGERPFGRRAGNRTITLPVLIIGQNRLNLAAAREVLEQAVDQDQWTLIWTRDPGPAGTALPLVIDCFRAQPSKPVYNTLTEKQLNMAQIELAIPALPYGRADTQQQIAFASPVPASPPPPPAAVVLDTFTQIASTQCVQSAQAIVGPNTAMWDPDDLVRVGDPGGQQTAFTYGPVPLSPAVNLTGLTALQFWLGFGSRYYPNLEYRGRITGVRVAVTFTDISGSTLSFSSSNLQLPVTPVAQAPVFTQVTIPIPQGSTNFSYAAVASYQLTITNRQYPVPRLAWVTCYLDHLTAVPPSIQVQPVTRGFVYTLTGLLGTARAPVSMTFQQPPGAGTPTTLATAGAGNYTVPAGTAWLRVENTGGGGPGATMTVAGNGGGGAGAEYAAEYLFPAAPGQVIPYSVGAGGTPGATPLPGQASVFGPGPAGSLQVVANGGQAAAQNSPIGAPGGTGSGNSVRYPGGAGRTNPAGTVGGGGGSSAGPASAGNTPQGTGSVLFTTPGTTMWTCPAGVFQVFAESTAAAGGGGTGSGGGHGAGGGGGEYRASFIPVTPGNSYPVVVGSGGGGGSGSGQPGSQGSLSSFTGDGGAQVIAEPGQGGLGGSWRGGGGAGGSGGTGTTGYNGGQGGPANPYSGGGGSSAGPSAPGNAGGSPAGAPAPPGGGAGGSGSGGGAGAGSPGAQPGGGGGGSYLAGYPGGNGGNGQVRITYPAGTGAPTSSGAAAVAGGGAGGAGGNTPGTAGSPGSAPGAGGGGAFSGGTTVQGGTGGTGQIKVTPYAPQPFRNLIVHRPPLGARKTFQPLVSVGAGADPPDGTHQYPMPQLIGGVNASFQGTYTVYLINASWSGTGQRNITVTVTQYEYGGGPSYSVSTVPVTITPAQVINGVVTAGVLTLPVKQVAADNTSGYYTVSVTSTVTADRFYDAIFLDTQGSTVVINEPSAGYPSYYIDEPDPVTSLGNIMGSQSGRPAAVSVTDNAVISGPAMSLEPADGANLLFVYSADGVAPSIALSYAPRYYFDRFQ